MRIFIILIVNCLALRLALARELKLIQVTFRHGHRAPTLSARSFYPLDPYANESWYPEGWGGLNKNGKKSAYELGSFLRERYGQWLGDIYLRNDVQFRSSISARVIMSTQLVAAGLFPPEQIQRWDLGLNWQPIPVYSDSCKINIFDLNMHMCPKHKAMQREVEERDDSLRRREEGLSEFFDFVSRNGGTNVKHEGISHIYAQLTAELSENVTLPNWTKTILDEGKFEEVAGYAYVIKSYNKTMIQMNGGPWIREWLKNVDDRLNGSRHNNYKGLFYGGHEANIAAILIALGIFEPHVPFYSSTLIFELSEANNEFYVKVLYRNRGLLQEMLIPGCGSIDCPLATFRQLFNDIIVEDPVTLCQDVQPLRKRNNTITVIGNNDE